MEICERADPCRSLISKTNGGHKCGGGISPAITSCFFVVEPRYAREALEIYKEMDKRKYCRAAVAGHRAGHGKRA